MDEMTQQNSALVEQNAATAKTLEHQAQVMNEQVSFFRDQERAVERPGRTSAMPVHGRAA
jgi:methyl-accepting chemotaxis protein